MPRLDKEGARLNFTIDTTSYPKSRTYPQRHGYQLRGTVPTSIVVHSTNNRKPSTAFSGECQFLYQSADVSAHYLIGKSGAIVQFLDPRAYQAWHVGEATDAYSNSKSIGIELHISVGEVPTQIQRDACAWLCSTLMFQFGIPADRIDTHRNVARPIGRKSDPEGWNNPDFYAWRNQPPIAAARKYRVKHCRVYQRQSLDGPLAAEYPSGTPLDIDVVYPNGAGHVASGAGFVSMRDLEEI